MFRILQGNPKKELLGGLGVGTQRMAGFAGLPTCTLQGFRVSGSRVSGFRGLGFGV